MKYDYCPRCGGHRSVEAESVSKSVCQNCEAVFWNNPVATASVVFIKENKALFAKRGIEPNKGKYDFPGGFVEYNEDVYDAAVREMAEETGIVIKKNKLVLIDGYTGEYLPGVSVVDLIFVITNWDGDFTAQDDVAALEWKPLSFINNPMFVPNYIGLDKKINAILKI